MVEHLSLSSRIFGNIETRIANNFLPKCSEENAFSPTFRQKGNGSLKDDMPFFFHLKPTPVRLKYLALLAGKIVGDLSGFSRKKTLSGMPLLRDLKGSLDVMFFEYEEHGLDEIDSS